MSSQFEVWLSSVVSRGVWSVGLVALLGSCSAEQSITAADPDAPADPVPARAVVDVTMSPDSATLPFLGDSIRLVARARDAIKYEIDGKVFVWTSSDSTIVTVSNGQSMDNEHKSVSGYSYVSTACLSCHPQGRE